MNRQVLQLNIDRQAEQQPARAEQQSPRQKRMSVQPEDVGKDHALQIRQFQARFAARLILRAGDCGQQQAHQDHHRFVLALQEDLQAFLDGARNLPHGCRAGTRSDRLPRRINGRKER